MFGVYLAPGEVEGVVSFSAGVAIVVCFAGTAGGGRVLPGRCVPLLTLNHVSPVDSCPLGLFSVVIFLDHGIVLQHPRCCHLCV